MKAVIVLPTYNESPNLAPLVERILRYDAVAAIVIVDDDSPDGTGTIADALETQHRSRVRVVHRRGRRGYGPASREGFGIAMQLSTDVIVQMDADGSHDPVHIPDMLAAAERAGLVIGSRYVAGGKVVNWPLRRRLLSRFANAYVQRVLHLPTRDCTSGFRVWRRSLLERLMTLPRDWSDGYAFLVQMLFLAVRERSAIVEIPIVFIERHHGRSKMSLRIMAESGVVPWRLRQEMRRASEKA